LSSWFCFPLGNHWLNFFLEKNFSFFSFPPPPSLNYYQFSGQETSAVTAILIVLLL